LIAEPRATRYTYAGLFFVALATLMYEILLTRIFSVTMLYHFAFVALSVAMFGMTAGALLVLAPQVLRATVSACSRARGRRIPGCDRAQLPDAAQHPVSRASVDRRDHAIGLTYVVVAVPFIVSGIAVCRRSRDFLLASAGSTRPIWRARPSDAYCSLASSITPMGQPRCSGSHYWPRAGRSRLPGTALRAIRRAAVAIAVVIGFAAIGHTILVWREFPIFRILYIKGSFEARPLYEKWNAYSRVRVNGDQTAEASPQGWGLSPTLPASSRVRQLQMDIDVGAGTVMTGYDGDAAALKHLERRHQHWLLPPSQRSDLVVGAGGGRDVLSALTLGASSVTAVEINKDIIRTANERFGDFTGHLDRDPRVRFVNDEARSYIARSDERFGLVQISLIDTWAATAAGAFVLSENSIYTKEAWTTFLNHLTDNGILSVSRWYFRDRPGEMYRTTTLAVEALRALGIEEPRPHIAIVRNMHLANRRAEIPDGVGTLLVSRSPFTPAELFRLDSVSAQLGFDIPFGPHTSADDAFVRLTTRDDLGNPRRLPTTSRRRSTAHSFQHASPRRLQA
jgi:hypothetical protein